MTTTTTTPDIAALCDEYRRDSYSMSRAELLKKWPSGPTRLDGASAVAVAQYASVLAPCGAEIPYCRAVENRRIIDVVSDLRDALRGHDAYERSDGPTALPYGPPSAIESPVPPHRWISVWPARGGSEGWYVHVEAVGSDAIGGDENQRVVLALCKCWSADDAWSVARRIAELLGTT